MGVSETGVVKTRALLARGAAEFAVVVLGVLVALAVDDVRVNRAERRAESLILERLANDLRADSADLAQARGQAARRMMATRTLLGELGADTAALKTLDAAVAQFVGDTIHSPLFEHPMKPIDAEPPTSSRRST